MNVLALLYLFTSKFELRPVFRWTLGESQDPSIVYHRLDWSLSQLKLDARRGTLWTIRRPIEALLPRRRWHGRKKQQNTHTKKPWRHDRLPCMCVLPDSGQRPCGLLAMFCLLTALLFLPPFHCVLVISLCVNLNKCWLHFNWHGPPTFVVAQSQS